MTTHTTRIIDPQIMNLSGGLFADAHAPGPILRLEPIAPAPRASRPVDQMLLLLSGEIFVPCPAADEALPAAPREGDAPQPPAPSRPRRAGVALLTGLLGGLAFCAGVLAGQGTAPGAAGRPAVLLAAGPALEAAASSALALASPEPGEPAAPAAASTPPAQRRAAARIARAAAPAMIPGPGAAPPAPAPVAAPAGDPAPVHTAAPAVPAAPGINASAAATALAIAAARAGHCVEPGDARTTVPVRVTFSPSGRVTTAAVAGGPFAGTEIGGCVARALRTATVAPFDGPVVTVRRTVQIR